MSTVNSTTAPATEAEMLTRVSALSEFLSEPEPELSKEEEGRRVMAANLSDSLRTLGEMFAVHKGASIASRTEATALEKEKAKQKELRDLYQAKRDKYKAVMAEAYYADQNRAFEAKMRADEKAEEKALRKAQEAKNEQRYKDSLRREDEATAEKKKKDEVISTAAKARMDKDFLTYLSRNDFFRDEYGQLNIKNINDVSLAEAYKIYKDRIAGINPKIKSNYVLESSRNPDWLNLWPNSSSTRPPVAKAKAAPGTQKVANNLSYYSGYITQPPVANANAAPDTQKAVIDLNEFSEYIK